MVLSARREHELERVARACASAKTLIRPLDLAALASPEAHVAAVVERFGRIDILVNNAGISQRSLATDTPSSVDRHIMKVDCFAKVALSKAVLPGMLERSHGHIVAISSLARRMGIPLRSAYSAAKHTLHGFFDTLRVKLFGSDVDVTVIRRTYARRSR